MEIYIRRCMECKKIIGFKDDKGRKISKAKFTKLWKKRKAKVSITHGCCWSCYRIIKKTKMRAAFLPP